MGLHVREWGDGDRVAVLLHGMVGDSGTWWRVGPAIAGRGYRVVAVDLPGHGCSPADPDATLRGAAEAVACSVPSAPEVALGHSLGGAVLAVGLDVIRPRRAVYVDSAFDFDGTGLPDDVAGFYGDQQRSRTLAHLRTQRPHWHEQDCRAEAEATQVWDVATSVSLTRDAARRDVTPPVAVPSLVVRADPSGHVPAARAATLAAAGFTVRSVPGAGHAVHLGHHDEFLAALEGWL